MARTRTLVQLRSDVRISADIGNALTRHPDTQLTRWINESIQELREIVSDAGHNFYLKIVTGTVGNTDHHIQLPADFIGVYGIDIDVNGISQTLWPFTLAERNDVGGIYAGGNPVRGIPKYYDLIGKSQDSVDNVALLMPPPDAPYLWRLWYLPTWTDLSLDGDTFDGVADWERWVVWDVCCKVAVRDKNSSLYELASAERAKKRTIIDTKKVQRQREPIHRVDTKGRRRLSETWRRFGWWPPP